MIDPFKFIKLHWPNAVLTSEQIRIIESVWLNDETYVPAANMVGKDFVASIIIVTFFVTNDPVRVITTSVKDEHLDVLWGEVDVRLRESTYALKDEDGGPLLYNHHEIRKTIDGSIDKYSYLKGQVSKKGEGMSGHHAKHTLLVIDEASGVDQVIYDMGTAWAKKILVLGNTWPCNNFFRHAVKGKPGTEDRGGDILSASGDYYYRKVIKIRAEDSPNVKLALKQKSLGKKPTGEVVVPGVLTWKEYCKRRATWDKIRQSVGLDAEFYESGDLFMFPKENLDAAEVYAVSLPAGRKAVAIGVDTGQGTADTTMVAVDRHGVIAMRSKKTKDTSVIPGEIIGFAKEVGLTDMANVLLDRGGGGKEHADILRSRGYMVRTVAFGEAASAPVKRWQRVISPYAERVDNNEVRYAYKNRRAEIYGLLMNLLSPNRKLRFGIPAEIMNRPRPDGGPSLREQLRPIPLQYDEEGRLKLPPKYRKNPDNKTEESLASIIGCSPDEADALALAAYGLKKKSSTATVGSMV